MPASSAATIPAWSRSTSPRRSFRPAAADGSAPGRAPRRRRFADAGDGAGRQERLHGARRLVNRALPSRAAVKRRVERLVADLRGEGSALSLPARQQRCGRSGACSGSPSPSVVEAHDCPAVRVLVEGATSERRGSPVMWRWMRSARADLKAQPGIPLHPACPLSRRRALQLGPATLAAGLNGWRVEDLDGRTRRPSSTRRDPRGGDPVALRQLGMSSR